MKKYLQFLLISAIVVAWLGANLYFTGIIVDSPSLRNLLLFGLWCTFSLTTLMWVMFKDR